MVEKSKINSGIRKKTIEPKITIVVKKEHISKINNIIKNKKIEHDFEPSMKILQRITETIMKKGSESKTNLSLDANLNYARLAKHIVWLEKKGLVESIIKDSRINVGLTEKGRIFASTILK